MDLAYYFVGALAGLSLLEFLLIPALRRQVGVDRSIATIGKQALLAMLQVLRAALLVTLLTTALIIIGMGILGMAGGATTAQVVRVLETARWLRAAINHMSPLWGGIASVVLIIALAIYASRQSRLQMQRTFQALFDREYARLSDLYDRGEIPPQATNREIIQIRHQLAEAYRQLAQLETDPAKTNQSGRSSRTKHTAEQLTRQIASLEHQIKAQEIGQRVTVLLNQEQVALPRATTWRDRVQVFFISRGLLNTMQGVSRLIFIAGLVLLIPSLLNLYADTLKQRLDTRIVQLEDLKLSTVANDIRAEYEHEISALGPPSYDLNDDDKLVIEQTAQRIERAIAQSMVTAADTDTLFQLHANAVRAQILLNLVNHSDGQVIALDTGSQLEQISPLDRELLAITEQTVAQVEATPSQFNQALRESLTNTARRSPGFIDSLRTRLQSFQKPASSEDIGRALVSYTIGSLIEGPGQSEMGRYLQTTLQQQTRLIAEVADVPAERITLDLLRGQGIQQAVDTAVAAPELFRMQPVMRVVLDGPVIQASDALRAFPPTIDNISQPNLDITSAQAILQELYKIRRQGGWNDVDLSQALVSFNDLFPAQQGIESATLSSMILSQWMNTPSNLATVSANNFARSRDFDKLNGYTHVGGVLIGRSPEPSINPQPDIIDIQWETINDQIRFILIDSSGHEYRTPLYRQSIAYYALQYAADGRPIGTTIIYAHPMSELKVLLHPTLIDTAMGSRIIELDNLVVPDGISNSIVHPVYAQDALYKLAWAQRLLTLYDVAKATNHNGVAASIPDTAIRQAKYYLSDAFLLDCKNDFGDIDFSQLSTITDSQRSLLAAKPEFYDQSLVTVMSHLSESSDTLEAYLAGVAEAVRQEADPPQFLVQRWSYLPPYIGMRSGVRETTFTTDLVSALPSKSNTRPLRFLLQIVFRTPPKFSPTSDEINTYNDVEAWDFPLSADDIDELTFAIVQSYPWMREVYSDSAEFTYLQRLFRMSLDGYLGSDIPLDKLSELAIVLEPSMPDAPVHTRRWQPDPDAWNEQLQVADDSEKEYLQSLRMALGIEKEPPLDRTVPLPPFE